MASPSLLWEPDVGRYRDPLTGRFVTRAAIRRALEESLANLTRRTDTLADDLRAGRISLTEWREEMRTIVKHTQMAAAEVAHGGRAQMTQADYGRVGQQVRTQYVYLENWVNEIKAGAPVDGRMEPRAALYLRAGRTAFLEAEKRELDERGFDERRSVLHVAEHCAQCIAEARRGFQAIGATIELGQRQCGPNDRCTWEYRNSRTGQVLAA